MNTQSGTVRRDEALPEQTRQRALLAPLVDIYENENEVLLVADVPGVPRENISIDLNKGELALTARRAEASDEGGQRSRGFDYYRAFLMPDGIDAAQITAELANGVLRVRLPKSAAVKPRRIEVKAG